MTDVMIIPADPRYPLDKKPLITNEMKVECIDKFSWDEDAPYYDENGTLIQYTATRTVPWRLVKEIYKRMAIVAAKHKQPNAELRREP